MTPQGKFYAYKFENNDRDGVWLRIFAYTNSGYTINEASVALGLRLLDALRGRGYEPVRV